jgi:hypothetical protein
MPGITTPQNISGSLDAKNIAMRVIKGSIEMTDLMPLCQTAQVPELTATIPVYSIPAGNEDLGPLEESEIDGSEFTDVEFSLKKDRVKVAVTDESRYKSRAGDPLSLQISGASDRLAQLAMKKIVSAANTDPQTSAGADWGGDNNPLADIATAVSAIRPFRATGIAMGTVAFGNYVANSSINNFGAGNISAFENATAVVPGYNIPIYVSEEIDDNISDEAAVVVAQNAPGLVMGMGPVKARRKDLMSGGEVYQIDVWRQVKGNIHQTDSDTNKACYVLTGLDTT